MTFDFKPLAVEFVRKHNCAQTTTVELVMKAMEVGAAEALHKATVRISNVSAELREQREQNLSGVFSNGV